MKRRPRVGVLLLGIVAAVMGACHRGGPAPAAPTVRPAAPAPAPEPPGPTRVPEEGGEGTFALEEPFISVAASKLSTSSDRMLRGLAFHGLTRLDASGKIEPELAVRWEMLRGGAEWLFHLRPDTPFANGRYFEARHAVASWERLAAVADARYAWLLEALNGFDDVRSGKSAHLAGLVMEDGLTLRVQLTRPVKDLLFRLAHPALGVSAFGEDEQGVGSFEIWGTPRSVQVTVRSNPEYFRGLPHMDEIVFVRGEAARPARLASGQLDASVLDPGEEAPSGPAARVFTHSVPRTYLLGLNRSRAPFARADTVRAFLGSLDREALRRAVAGEGGQIPATLVPGVGPGAAATAPGNGTPPAGLGRIDLLIPEADRGAALLAAKIQASLARAGGSGLLHPVNPADIGGVLRRGDYSLFVLPFVPSGPDPLLSYEELMQSNRSIPEPLLAQARALEGEGNLAALFSLLGPLDAALQEGGYLLPVLALERRLLVRRGICGLRPDPAGILDWTRIWVNTSPGKDCP